MFSYGRVTPVFFNTVQPLTLQHPLQGGPDAFLNARQSGGNGGVRESGAGGAYPSRIPKPTNMAAYKAGGSVVKGGGFGNR